MNHTNFLAWAAAGLWAQAPAATGDAWMTAVTNFGGLGVLAYVVWQLQQQTRNDAKEERKEAREERDAERAIWSKHLDEYRDEATKRYEMIMAELRSRPK